MPNTNNYQRGEIWLVKLDPTQGDEISKTRPCVILSRTSIGRLNLRIVVPITDWKDRYTNYPWMTRLEPDDNNSLTKSSAADAFQVRSVSLTRFAEFVGTISAERIDKIALTVGMCTRR